jgi:hypothetical protein
MLRVGLDFLLTLLFMANIIHVVENIIMVSTMIFTVVITIIFIIFIVTILVIIIIKSICYTNNDC